MSPTVASPEVGTDVSILETLDFEIPCEHSGHGQRGYTNDRGISALGHEGGAATWLYSYACPNCSVRTEKCTCDGWYTQACRSGIRCTSGCGVLHRQYTDCATFIPLPGGSL